MSLYLRGGRCGERGDKPWGKKPIADKKTKGLLAHTLWSSEKKEAHLRPNISLSLTSVTVLGTHDLLPRGCVVIVSLWLIAKPFLWRKAAHTQLPLQHGQRSVCVTSVMRKEIPRTGARSRERNAVSSGQGAGSLSWCLGLEALATCGHLPPTASLLWKLLHIDLPVSPVSWLCPIYLSQEWHS